MTTDNIEVHVTEALIRGGFAGDCLRCAVALAMDEATGDTECMVIEVDWTLHLVVWGHYIEAPDAVKQFVRMLDRLKRDDYGRPKLPRKLTKDLAPFQFTLPPITDRAWQEACYRCEELFDPDDLDDEGYCQDCRKAADGGPS